MTLTRLRTTEWRDASFSLWGPSDEDEAVKCRRQSLSLSLSPPTVGPSAVQRLDSSTVRTYSCWGEEEERDLKLYAVCNPTQNLALSNTQLSSEVLKKNRYQLKVKGGRAIVFPEISLSDSSAWRASAASLPGSCDEAMEDRRWPSHADISALMSVQRKKKEKKIRWASHGRGFRDPLWTHEEFLTAFVYVIASVQGS